MAPEVSIYAFVNGHWPGGVARGGEAKLGTPQLRLSARVSTWSSPHSR